MDFSSAVQCGHWYVLFDPGWNGDPTHGNPPLTVIVGGWRFAVDGGLGPFQPNPHYRPLTSETPTDPIDALLRLVRTEKAGDACSAQIIPTLNHTVIGIACDDQSRPLIAFSPDDRPCTVVVTAEVHKKRLDVQHWVSIIGSNLPNVLPNDTDVWFNPSSAHQFRLDGSILRCPSQE